MSTEVAVQGGAPAQVDDDVSGDLTALGGSLVAPDEMKRMWKVANMLANTRLVAEPLQGHPEMLMGVGLHLVGLGFPFDLVGIKMMHVWQDHKGVQMQLHYSAMIALAGRAGHDVWLDELAGDHATIGFVNRHSGRRTMFTYTMEMAATAGLLDQNERGQVKKENWRKNPHYALPAAAARMAIRFGCPEVLSGLDMGDDGTTTIRPVTPIQAPAHSPGQDGGGTRAAPPAGAAQPTGTPIPPVAPPLSADAREAITARAKAMGDEWHTKISVAWKSAGLPAIANQSLSADHLARIEAVFVAIEAERDEVHDRRRKAVFAKLGEVGIRSDDARHELIREATGGATESSKHLTGEQYQAVEAAIEALAAQDRAADEAAMTT